jgi:hypothetical protein
MATITLPTSETAPPAADGAASSESPALAVPGTEGQSLTVTHQQRGYLDALAAAGRKPSSEFLALSIGSYVCQAHAAKQSEQAVRDHVLPLVRSDVSASFSGSVPPPAAEVDAAAADYIRIATERLC